MNRACVLVVLAGCRLGFDVVADDGGTDDALGVDGGSDASGSDSGGTDGGPDGGTFVCPGNYVMLLGLASSSRYRIISTTSTWDAAEADCEADGHHLAIPDGASELSAISTALAPDNIWVGVTDRRTEGVWVGVTGTPTMYLPWEPGEPDPEDCVFIDGLTTMYRAQDCSSGRRYLCECDGAPADPASY